MLKLPIHKIHILTQIGLLNVIALTIILLTNIYYAILKQATYENYILYTAPLFILWLFSVICLLLKSFMGYGILYLLAGMFFAFLSTPNDVGATTLIFLSISCFNKISAAHKNIIYPIVMAVFFLIIFLKFAVFKILATNIIIVSIYYCNAYRLNYLINKEGNGQNGGIER